MAIFVATVSVEVAIEADSIKDVFIDAKQFAAEELLENESGTVDEITELTDPKSIPPKYRNTYPWGGDGKQTIDEILNQHSFEASPPAYCGKEVL